MFKLYFSLAMFQQLDSRIYELQKAIEFYKIIVTGFALVIVVLIFFVILQRISLGRARRAVDGAYAVSVNKNAGEDSFTENRIKRKKLPLNHAVDSKNLPDPGLIFKYSLAKDDVPEKIITIGQTTGSIKTYSTEIINDHLNIHIRIKENRNGEDIYSVSDSIYEEYIIDLRREGTALICFPGTDKFREMAIQERIYIMEDDASSADPVFPDIDPKEPLRIRLGEKLDGDEKFVNGYFEFHLFCSGYELKADKGIPVYKKNFMLRLYRIYPGYDVSSPDKNGLYPMMEPFGYAGK